MRAWSKFFCCKSLYILPKRMVWGTKYAKWKIPTAHTHTECHISTLLNVCEISWGMFSQHEMPTLCRVMWNCWMPCPMWNISGTNWIYVLKDSYLCDDDDWSKRLVIGSNRNVAGTLYGPEPARFAAATLTVYVTPSVKLANKSDGVAASMVTLVRMRDLFEFTSMPRTIIWYVWSTPVVCGQTGEEKSKKNVNRENANMEIISIRNERNSISILRPNELQWTSESISISISCKYIASTRVKSLINIAKKLNELVLSPSSHRIAEGKVEEKRGRNTNKRREREQCDFFPFILWTRPFAVKWMNEILIDDVLLPIQRTKQTYDESLDIWHLIKETREIANSLQTFAFRLLLGNCKCISPQATPRLSRHFHDFVYPIVRFT